MKALWPIFCRGVVQKRKKKGNEDDMATLDDSGEGEFYRTLRRLAPSKPEFYGE